MVGGIKMMGMLLSGVGLYDFYLREKFVSKLRTMLGITYVYGGTTVNGIDCSAFVRAGYGLMGIAIPRLVTEQAKFAQIKIPIAGISLKNLRMIALKGYCIGVGFAENGRYVHTGVSTGGGKIIHASSGHGKVVEVELNQWWADNARTLYRFVLSNTGGE